MKTRVSSRKSHYVKGAGILVLVAALIAGMVGCPADSEPDPDPVLYSLTVSSTTGGVVTEPGEGGFTYEEATVVSLVGEAEEGYQFVNWTGDVGTVADPEAAETTVTMNGNYSITANFQAVSDVVPVLDWYDLDSIRNDLAGHYVLMNDLDSASPGYEELASASANEGKGWEPIGTSDGRFDGHFDGQGYEIGDLFINRPDEDHIGLFGVVDEGGFIKDLGVIRAEVIGAELIGGLVGLNGGMLKNCYSSGTVAGERNVGGLVGVNLGGAVSDCYSSGTVTGERAVAGLVGYNRAGGTVSNCYSSATVVGGWQYIGGLVGAQYNATVSNSHYNYDEVLISGQNIITTGALFRDDFEEWLANDKFLDVDERLSQEDGYYLIDNVSDFKQLLAFGQDGSLKFRLQNDLDLGNDPNFFIPYLAGEFDGDGHKIWNLSFNIDFVSQVGLFGNVAVGARVTGVGAENVDITGARSVGGLVGANEGTVSDCYSTGVLRNTRQVGGLVGGNGGTITNSFSTASVSGFHIVGGLVGGNVAVVSGCHATGDVTGDDASVGGLVGGNSGTISDCYYAGSVTGHVFVGGLVGATDDASDISESYSDGSVSGSRWVGGLAGRNAGTVSDSRSSATVSGETGIGGLVGVNTGTLSNSYSTGHVLGEDRVGGLVGENSSNGIVGSCYSAGVVTGEDRVGGLVGWNRDTVANSFWDIETSGQPTSDGGTGKTTDEMTDIATFTNTDTEGLDEPWDMTGVAPDMTNPAYTWNIVNGQTYPFLGWESVG